MAVWIQTRLIRENTEKMNEKSFSLVFSFSLFVSTHMFYVRLICFLNNDKLMLELIFF